MAWLGIWENRRKITISNINIDSALSNFPILVKISASSGSGSDDITDIFSELGSDANRKKIAITTDNGETQCYVEIERFDYTNSTAWLWVKVPSVSDSVGTELYIYYDSSQSDNTTYIGDTTEAAAQSVWDSNFKLVSHMAQDPNGDVADAIKDSTSNANHGTPIGSMTTADLVDGKIGKAIDFDGSNDRISLPTNDGLYGQDEITVEAIVKSVGLGTTWPDYRGTIYSTRDDINTKGFSIWFDNDSGAKKITIQNRDSEGGVIDTSNSVWLDSTNYHVVMTHKANVSQEIWLNKILLKSDTQNWDFQKGVNGPLIGQEAVDTYEWPGIIDEVRISNITRSAAWIKATYYSNWDELVSYDNVEEYHMLPFVSTSLLHSDIEVYLSNNLFTATSSMSVVEIFSGGLVECPSPFYAQANLQSNPQIEVNQSLFTSTGSLYVQPEFQLFTGGSLSATGSISAIITDPFSVAILPRVYTFTLTGAADGVDDIVIPIKSFQSRLKNIAWGQSVSQGDYGRSAYTWHTERTYLSVVISGMDYAEQINNRLGGKLVLRMGYNQNGTIILQTIIAETDFDDIVIYNGTTNESIILQGYGTKTIIGGTQEINLTGSSYKNITAGKLRYRCTPNLYVRPGDTANIDDDSFKIENITYSVSTELENFEVSE